MRGHGGVTVFVRRMTSPQRKRARIPTCWRVLEVTFGRPKRVPCAPRFRPTTPNDMNFQCLATVACVTGMIMARCVGANENAMNSQCFGEVGGFQCHVGDNSGSKSNLQHVPAPENSKGFVLRGHGGVTVLFNA